MSRTSPLRTQHLELLHHVSEIEAFLEPALLARDASKARRWLSEVLGKLKVHLAMEDKVLYPFLLSSADEEVRDIAHAYMEEMGGLSRAVDDYSAKWSSPLPIQEDPEGFIGDTREIFCALARRVEKEDHELYPLVDRLPR